MLVKFFQIVTGFISGYLFIRWFPVSFPIDLSEMIVIFVLEPFAFFAAMVIFIIGFMANAEIIRDGIELTAGLINQRKVSLTQLLTSYLILGSFTVLFTVAFWETAVLFCFSTIYGIISLDFKKLKSVED